MTTLPLSTHAEVWCERCKALVAPTEARGGYVFGAKCGHCVGIWLEQSRILIDARVREPRVRRAS